MLSDGESAPAFSAALREQMVNPAASALAIRAHFHDSPLIPVIRPSLIPGTTRNCDEASALPLFLMFSVATASPPGRGPAGAMNEGTRSAANSVIATVMPKRATGACLMATSVANTGHSGEPTFAFSDARTVRFNTGVAASGAMADANLISHRIAGPAFFDVTAGAEVLGATVVDSVSADATFVASTGISTFGMVPLPETHTHLPAAAVLIFWLSRVAL